MKKIIFLIIASLLVIGLVLPGCGGNGVVKGIATFTDAEIKVGIAGELAHFTGLNQKIGATVAAGQINAGDPITIGGVEHTIVLVDIETGEASVDPAGGDGYDAMVDKIDEVNFVLGGFRSEAVKIYREVVMEEQKLFMNCGAATEELQHSVVDDYNTYQYWFKVTPYNEYFLGQSVARTLDRVATQFRADNGMAANATLDAVILYDDLLWAYEQVDVIKDSITDMGLDIDVKDDQAIDPLLVSDQWLTILGTIAATYDPHFIVPVFSADAGVAYTNYRQALVAANSLHAMSVGINVPAQLNSEDMWGDPFTNSTYCPVMDEVILDTWAVGVNQTAMTAGFLEAVMAYTGGVYPLYTAATFDGMYGLAAAIEAEATYDEEAGVASVAQTDIIGWLEDNQTLSTVGTTAYYPLPGTTTTTGVPALSEAQKETLYGDSWTYDKEEWTMPGHTTHDLVYGPDYLTGLGAQWQWTGAEWEKVGVWPQVGYGWTDQYGDWDFAWNGTVSLNIPAWFLAYW